MTLAPCDDCYGFTYMREITIDPSNVTDDLINFPVLIHASLNPAHVNSVAAWDTAFYLESGGVCTLLKHDIHDYNAGDYWAWVQIPRLDSAATMTLWLFYGKAGVAADPSDSTVWTDKTYKSVWHMTDASGGIQDAAGFKNGTESGAPTYCANGKISRCVSFASAGGSDYFNITDNTWKWEHNSHFTLEAWVKIDDLDTARIWMFSDTDGTPRLTLYYSNGAVRWEFDAVQGGGVEELVTGNTAPSINTWYHIVCRQSHASNELCMFVNGIKQTDTEPVPAYNTASGSGFISYIAASNGGTLPLDGDLQELRIHATLALSDDWIWQTWRCADDPATFATIGAELTCSTTTPPIPTECEPVCCDHSCGTFFIKGDSYTLCFRLPDSMNGVDREVKEDVLRFNFWDGDYVVVDNSKNGEALILTGTEFYTCESNPSPPVGYEAYWMFYCKFAFLSEMMDNNEKLQIYGIDDCIDALYVVKSFRYATVPGVIQSLAWEMTLEYVRDLTDAEKAAF